MNKIYTLLTNKKFIRYFIMALIIVLIELAVFQVIYLIFNNYFLGTFISFGVAVLLNWIAGRMFVFGTSHHHPAKEFMMVLAASIVGVTIQIGVVYTSVQLLLLYPLAGKGLSIIFSFFWNYWFRVRIVYKYSEQV